MPSLRIFLDVDDLLSTDDLERHVSESDVVIVFLTGATRHGCARSDYFESKNCLREFRHAVDAGKPIILIQETDFAHGHVPLEVHRDACPTELRGAFDNLAMHVVPWYRAKVFRSVSLLMILRELLRRPGSCNGSVAEEAIAVNDPALQASRGEGFELAELGAGEYHLYASPSNQGAADVAHLMAAQAELDGSTGRVSRSGSAFAGAAPKKTKRLLVDGVGGGSEKPTKPKLAVTTNPEDQFKARRFLLLLNEHTHTRGAASERLHEELGAALDRRMPLLLVHEQRAGHDAVPFEFFFSSRGGQSVTPTYLLGSDSTESSPARPSIYAELATPLYDGAEHQAASLREMLATKGIRREPPVQLAGPDHLVAPGALTWLPWRWASGSRARPNSRKLTTLWRLKSRRGGVGRLPGPAEQELEAQGRDDADLDTTAAI